MREYTRRPGKAEIVRTRVRRYREEHAEEIRFRDQDRGYRVYDILKERARHAAYRAIERGELVREPCEACGESPVGVDGRSLVQAHHNDYAEPLEVRWLCARCHGIEHRSLP